MCGNSLLDDDPIQEAYSPFPSVYAALFTFVVQVHLNEYASDLFLLFICILYKLWKELSFKPIVGVFYDDR